MIDLHIHSIESDGSDDYKTILRKAEELGLECISITDHDNCKAYELMEKEDIKKYYSGKLITGVELQAYIKGFSIELLGYLIDYKVINKEVEGLYLPFEQRNKLELERLYNKCIKIGMRFKNNLLEDYKNSKVYYATEYLHSEMKKDMYNKQFVPDEESWEKESIFFKRHTSNINSKFYIDESDLIPSASKVIEIIKKAGGLVFIPHIYEYKENAITILEDLINNYTIDGIECFYSTFKEEQIKYLLDYCKSKNKYISGGTDYHGSNRPSIELGKGTGSLNIKYDFVKEWIEKP